MRLYISLRPLDPEASASDPRGRILHELLLWAAPANRSPCVPKLPQKPSTSPTACVPKLPANQSPGPRPLAHRQHVQARLHGIEQHARPARQPDCFAARVRQRGPKTDGRKRHGLVSKTGFQIAYNRVCGPRGHPVDSWVEKPRGRNYGPKTGPRKKRKRPGLRAVASRPVCSAVQSRNESASQGNSPAITLAANSRQRSQQNVVPTYGSPHRGQSWTRES